MRILVRPRQHGVPRDLGRPRLPGSKSHTQRAMLLAAFLPGDRLLAGALRSRDTEVLAAALRRCGAHCRWSRRGLLVRGRHRGAPLDVDLHVGENGTALRSLLLLVPLLGGRLRIDGSAGLRRRPIAPALQALTDAGIAVCGRRLPVVVDGRARALAPVTVAADITSQAATGALLAAALHGSGDGGLASRPVLVRIVRPAAPAYLQLTIAMLRQFGFAVRTLVVGQELRCHVRVQRAPPRLFRIPPDPSARTFPLVLAALHGRDASKLLPRVVGDPHPEWHSDDDCARLRVAGTARLTLRGLHARPDTVPALAALAAVRAGTTVFPGVSVLRHKESDRLRAIVRGLAALGACCRVRGGQLTVTGPLRAGRQPVLVPCPPDHRLVMALALLGTVLPHGVVVPHPAAVQKSWPGFFAWLRRCARVRTLPGGAARRRLLTAASVRARRTRG